LILAIVPARSGSKGIPGKNLVEFYKKPLIQYTVEAALASKLIDDTVLSTDDPQIKEVTSKFGLSTTYIRPDYLATDSAGMVDVVLHCLDWYIHKNGDIVSDVILLQPTSPLRTAFDIDAALGLYLESKCNSLVSVNRMTHHPYECIKGKSSDWEFIAKSESNPSRRQDYEDNFYFINGAIYIASIKHLRKKRSFIDEGKSLIYVMTPERGLDIDYKEDLLYGEFILSNSLA